jgi:hypothetical protein
MKSKDCGVKTSAHQMWNWSAMALTMAAVVTLAAGCGRQEDRAASAGGAAPDAAIAEQRAPVVAAAPAASPALAAQAGAQAEPQEERGDAISIDSLPPDVAAYVASKIVEPGEIIEVAAQGSPDVSGIDLSDGIGHAQPMTYDSTAGLWRTYYRVPIRTTAERLGLSVTAKNSLHRWRRVWVFLTVQREGAQPDSLSDH